MRYAACIAALIVGLVAAHLGVAEAPIAFILAFWLALNEK